MSLLCSKRDKEENLRNYRTVNLMLIVEKVIEQLILETSSRCTNTKSWRSNQHRFTKSVMHDQQQPDNKNYWPDGPGENS